MCQKPLKPITLANVMCKNIFDYYISKLLCFYTERGFFFTLAYTRTTNILLFCSQKSFYFRIYEH